MLDELTRVHALIDAAEGQDNVTIDLTDAKLLFILALERLQASSTSAEPVEPDSVPQVASGFLDAMNPYAWGKLRDWMVNFRRPPAQSSFEPGVMRDAARAFEAALNIVQR